MINVFRDLAQLPVFKNAVITIGTFDGVHTGHRQIIHLLNQEANETGGESVIITFYPHPRKIVAQGKQDIKILNTLEEKTALLQQAGVANLVVIPFDGAFAQQSANEYVEHFLVKKFHPHTIIIGYDHRYGQGRLGDYHLLEELGEKFNYKVKEIPEHILNEVTVSSTRIRKALKDCRVAEANELLGYLYFFEGKVIKGNQLGRTIGYPTANVEVEDAEKLIPGNGVYAVQLQIDNGVQRYHGMMNIGTRPTIGGIRQTIEVNIFDFQNDIYGCTLKVYLVAYLRVEVKFDGLDMLKEQLAKDEVNARGLLEDK